MLTSISVAIFLNAVVISADVFPITGEWFMSRTNALLTFSNTSVTGYTILDDFIEGIVGTTYDLHLKRGNRFVIVSRNGGFIDRNAVRGYIATCLNFVSVGEDIVVFTHDTRTASSGRPLYSQVLVVPGSGPPDIVFDDICNPNTQSEHEYFVLVRQAGLTRLSVPCPSVIQATFNATGRDGLCQSTLDGCTDASVINVQSSCNTTTPFYAGSSPPACVLSRTAGNDTYLTVVNSASTQTDKRFVCALLVDQGDQVTMYQRPLACISDQRQNTTLFTLLRDPCPVQIVSTTTVVPPAESSTLIIVIIALVVIAILLFVICVVGVCIRRRRRRERERKEAERRQHMHEERERRRQEKEERRKQGLPVSDTDSEHSSDSGFVRQSTSSSSKLIHGGVLVRGKRPRTPRKLGKRYRRIYDEQGNLIREEEDSDDFDDSGEETIYIADENGRIWKRRRTKKTRKYVVKKSLPNGETATELVESDYWDTVSERSVHSGEDWEEEEETVQAQIQRARLRRKLQRDNMIEKLAEAGEGPVTFRPELQRSPTELFASRKNRSDAQRAMVRKLKRRERHRANEAFESKETPKEDRFLGQYLEKKRIERQLDDEGFWEDERAKQTAQKIFNFDMLDAQLSQESPGVFAVKPLASTELSTHNKTGAATGDVSKDDNKELSIQVEEKPKTEVIDVVTKKTDPEVKKQQLQKAKSHEKVKDVVTEKTDPEVKKQQLQKETSLEKGKQSIASRISKLLSQRLLGDDVSSQSSLKLAESKKSGKVIFVEEKSSPVTKSRSEPALPPVRQVGTQGVVQSRSDPNTFDSDKAAMYREGLAKDKEIISSLAADIEIINETNDVETDNDMSSGSKLHGGTSWRPVPSFRGQPRQAWGADSAGHRTSPSKDRSPSPSKDRSPSPSQVPYSVSTPRFHSYLNFLRGRGGSRSGYLTDRETPVGSGFKKMRYIDDARLKRLLEELYKDKKFMDKLIQAEASGNEDQVSSLATDGRDYLVRMADYWEEKGPLPTRPSMTRLGFKQQRARTAIGNETVDRPSFDRHKTVC